MTTRQDDVLLPDTSRIGSRMSRISPDIFRNQDASPSTDGDKEEAEDTEENVFSDAPIDADGSATEEQEKQQDDNNALGDHVARSGNVQV